MPKFIKKPVEVEAIQFKGSTTDMVDIQRWINMGIYTESTVKSRDIRSFELATVHGLQVVNAGDWVVKANNDEFYPVAASVFDLNYGEVPDSWLERVELEQAELQIKTDALNKILDVSSKPVFISDPQWLLMHRQKFHQNQLNNILIERIQIEKSI